MHLFIISIPVALLFLFMLIISMAAWFASERLLRVSEEWYMVKIRVIGVTEGTVTLQRRGGSAFAGVYGISWQSEYAVLGEIVASDARTVTRRIIETTQPPVAGLIVYWNTFVYQGDPACTRGVVYEDVKVPNQLGALPAWFVAGQRSTWVLLLHGFHGTREEGLRVLPALAQLGFPVLLMSYRNDVGGPLSPDRFYHFGDTEWQDVEAGVCYALEHGAQDIVLYGWSMGGCMAETFLHRSSYAARIRAVVLDSPVLDWHKAIDTQVRQLHMPHWFTFVLQWFAARRAGIDFAALNHECPVPERNTPTLLFHGSADAMVSVESSDIFAQFLPDLITYQRIDGADHGQVWNVDPQTYEDALKAFLTRVCVPASQVVREADTTYGSTL